MEYDGLFSRNQLIGSYKIYKTYLNLFYGGLMDSEERSRGEIEQDELNKEMILEIFL